jgi:hypothetical protein
MTIRTRILRWLLRRSGVHMYVVVRRGRTWHATFGDEPTGYYVASLLQVAAKVTADDRGGLTEQVETLLAGNGNTVTRSRYRGVHVAPIDGGGVCVCVDFPGLDYAERRTSVIAEQLRDAGYQVAAESFPRTLLYVTEPALERAQEARS